MRKRLIIFLSFIVVLGMSLLSVAQFTPEELAERAKWEDYLATAKIVGQEQMGGEEAVTNPWKLTLEKDGIRRNALWKNAKGMMKGYLEGWNYEISAYRMDKLLGLNMVPPTVEIRFRGDRGSCQLWIEDTMSLKTKEAKKIKTPSFKIFYWNRATYLQRAFDNLIANEDRHMNQILITKDWRMILIDHSRSFRTGKVRGIDYTNSLIYTEKHKEGPKLMSELPRAFVEKIKALNFQMIKDAVGEYLTDDEINAVLARKELVLKEIDKLIAKNGEANVLYD
jgi:hypothetical protein